MAESTAADSKAGALIAPLADLGQNPYVGPRTFRTEERELFFGRDNEARDLLSLVLAERLVVFYAQSGAGKSSLLNTRLRPELEKAGYRVLPTGRVSGDLPDGIQTTDDFNIFVFNLLLRLDQNRRSPAALAATRLLDYLRQEGLVAPEVPAALVDAEDDEDEQPASAPAPAAPLPMPPRPTPPRSIVLIIDQFEEILTTHGDQWPSREGFMRQVREAMNAAPNLSVVLVLREDFVASLDPYARLLPGRLRTRFYMQRMGVEAAKQAIEKPARQYGRHFAADALMHLVDNLRRTRMLGQEQLSQSIELVQLQVVCQQLWARRKDPTAPMISLADVQEAGDVDSALKDFYEETIASALTTQPLAGGERRLRTWVQEKLITEAGTRSTVYQGERESAGLPNTLVRELANRFLLRSEARAGGTWLELTHDRFVEPILEANRAWETRQNNPLTAITRLWLENGRDPARLLTGQQLIDAQAFAQAKGELFSADEQAFLKASTEAEVEEKARLAEAARQAEMQRLQNEAVVQRRGARNLRWMIAVVTALALLALIATGWALQQRDRAMVAQATAEAARQESEQLKDQLHADQLAQAARVVGSEDNLPQRGLLLAVAASVAITPSLPSAPQALHALLGHIGGQPRSGHEDAVRAVAFSPDGKTLASASVDKTIRLWQVDQPSADPIVLRGHANTVNAVAFSPDGKTLASASSDNTIRLWQVDQPSADPIVLRGHADYVLAVAFSPDGKTLASGSWDNTIRLWQVDQPTADPLILRGHANPVYAVAFSPDGKTLASGSWDNTIRLWQVDQPSADPLILRGHANPVYAVAFSPDGKTLASGSWDRTIRLWQVDQPTADPIVLRGHANGVLAVAFSPDGKTLASGSGDNTIRLWQVDQPTADPLILRGHEDYVWSVAFSPDGKTLASGSWDNTIRLWQVDQPSADPLILRGHDDIVNAVAFSPDGKTLASGSDDRTIRLWQVDQPSADPIVLRSVGHLSMAANFMVDQPSADPIVLRGHDDIVNAVAFSPDGKTLASGSSDKTIRLWQVDQPSADPIVLRGHDDIVNAVAFSPDGKTLASGSSDKTIRLWQVDQPSADPLILRGHANPVYAVAFSPDGKTLASGSLDRTIRLWQVDQPSVDPIVLRGHANGVLAVAFSPDGKTLASGSDDRTIRLWQVDQPSADPIVLRGHANTVNAVAFSPDGKTLASASWENTIRLWRVSLDDLRALACATVGRNFSRVEWAQYFPGESYRRTCPQWPDGE